VAAGVHMPARFNALAILPKPGATLHAPSSGCTLLSNGRLLRRPMHRHLASGKRHTSRSSTFWSTDASKLPMAGLPLALASRSAQEQKPSLEHLVILLLHVTPTHVTLEDHHLPNVSCAALSKFLSRHGAHQSGLAAHLWVQRSAAALASPLVALMYRTASTLSACTALTDERC